jgi:hypothetical protein
MELLPDPLPSRELRALRDKYARILLLRTAHARARSDAAFVEPDPRDAMTRLAQEFPGALRELDQLPLATIVERIAALEAAEGDPLAIERWMRAQAVFHRLARGALVAKGWLGGRKRVTTSTCAAYRDALATLRFGDDAAMFAEDLERVASPPRGRLMDLVHARAAEVLGVTPREVRQLVFGAPREVR